MNTPKLVLVSAPHTESAQQLARAALEARLAACANIIPGVRSLYWWQGAIEDEQEVLILFKTTAELVPTLEREILSRHPYSTPEFVVLDPEMLTAKYQQWLIEELSLTATPVPKNQR